MPRLLLVVAPYYRKITELLIRGATAQLENEGATHELAFVPGALEIPTAIRLADVANEFDAFVALGCVVRGETTHYDTVCTESSRGLMLLGLRGYCIGNGILNVENLEQARERAAPEEQDKGGEAAKAALYLLSIKQRFGNRSATVGFRAGAGSES